MRVYGNLALKQSPVFDPRVQKQPLGSKLALRCLNSRLAPRKEWAGRLGVGERTISKWVSGESNIPEQRASQILWIAKQLSIEVSQLRDELDLFLAATYGPGVDPDNF